MVFNPVGERGEGEEIVLVNPRVNKYSKKIVLFNEGCLSFPGIYADVEVSINADSSLFFILFIDLFCLVPFSLTSIQSSIQEMVTLNN